MFQAVIIILVCMRASVCVFGEGGHLPRDLYFPIYHTIMLFYTHNATTIEREILYFELIYIASANVYMIKHKVRWWKW